MSKAKDLQQLIKTLVGSNPSPAQVRTSIHFMEFFKNFSSHLIHI